MAKAVKRTGIQSLLNFYRSMFQIPENIDYYSPEDYREAERKFLKFCLMSGAHGGSPS